jgi:hypothetical protein
MTYFAVAHYENADRPIKELKPTFHTNDHHETIAKFQEWCASGGPSGSGGVFLDNALFSGTCHRHVF